jgi:hypothetical protein
VVIGGAVAEIKPENIDPGSHQAGDHVARFAGGSNSGHDFGASVYCGYHNCCPLCRRCGGVAPVGFIPTAVKMMPASLVLRQCAGGRKLPPGKKLTYQIGKVGEEAIYLVLVDKQSQ